MPAELVDLEVATAYLEGAGLGDRSEEELAAAFAGATDRIRQAALNEYTSASFESLTPETTPPEMRDNFLSLFAGLVSKGDANRPESVKTNYDEASRWLGFMVGGLTHFDLVDGAVLVKHDSSSVRVTSSRRDERIFDRATTTSTYNFRDPRI
jgi:hypothetical protein